jgi:hypothetical protein
MRSSFGEFFISPFQKRKIKAKEDRGGRKRCEKEWKWE